MYAFAREGLLPEARLWLLLLCVLSIFALWHGEAGRVGLNQLRDLKPPPDASGRRFFSGHGGTEGKLSLNGGVGARVPLYAGLFDFTWVCAAWDSVRR